MVQHAGATRLGQELRTEADERARRYEVVEAHPPGAVVHHLLQPALAQREQLRHHTEELLGHVDRHPLHRFVHLSVDEPGHHLRLADGELEALASHHLD